LPAASFFGSSGVTLTMRALLLIAGAALALVACGKNDQSGAAQNVGDDLTASNIVSNDVTAIDAVTGDAANMAADVDMNFGVADLNAEMPATNEGSPVPAKRPAARPAGPAPAPSSTTANSTANATANSQ